jgi:hypothetical protein
LLALVTMPTMEYPLVRMQTLVPLRMSLAIS